MEGDISDRTYAEYVDSLMLFKGYAFEIDDERERQEEEREKEREERKSEGTD